jgi:hypothetical protein
VGRYHLIRRTCACIIVLFFLSVNIIQPGSSSPFIKTASRTTESPMYLSEQKQKESLCSSSQNPVYSLTPDWVSGSPHYSTGGAFTDINNDGWLDFVVSDGNDMGQGHVRVYLNDGNGHLATQASWQSSDIAYNGHLDVADIDGDGWCDVAVSYLGTGSSLGPIARVYMNTNGVLSSAPSWSSSIIGNAFGVDFGDMNNDGRPDLAIATGWSYDSYHYHTYVYLNFEGAYGSTPSWQSTDDNVYMNVLWVDADNDGWLDLAGIADGTQTQIYRNINGTLETAASWFTTDSQNQFGIMLTAGDVTGDGIRELFATDNTQLGGDGYFKQYTGLSGGFFETTHSWGYYGNYGSAVALADVNADNTLDLAAGAWWESTFLFLNQGTSLPTTPSWSSTYETVVEKIVFGNIGPVYSEETFTEVFSPDGSRRCFYLPHRQIQGIETVTCDGVVLSPSEYTYSRDEGWVAVATIPTESLEVIYRYSTSQDMAVTNWDPSVGNYLYYNLLDNTTSPRVDGTPYMSANLECSGSLSWMDIEPGVTIMGNFTVSNIGNTQTSLNWEVNSTPEWGAWSFTPASGINLSGGDSCNVVVTLIVPTEENTQYAGNITILNTDKPSDCCVLPVTVSTPVIRNHDRILYQKVCSFLGLLRIL